MPVVQVESVWPAGVQNEIRTDAAESSAGSTTTHEISIDVGLERQQLQTNITIGESISILSIKGGVNENLLVPVQDTHGKAYFWSNKTTSESKLTTCNWELRNHFPQCNLSFILSSRLKAVRPGWLRYLPWLSIARKPSCNSRWASQRVHHSQDRLQFRERGQFPERNIRT